LIQLSPKASENSIRLELEKKGKRALQQAAQVNSSFPCRARGHLSNVGRDHALVWVGNPWLASKKNPMQGQILDAGQKWTAPATSTPDFFVRSESWKPHLRLLHFSAAVVVEA